MIFIVDIVALETVIFAVSSVFPANELSTISPYWSVTVL